MVEGVEFTGVLLKRSGGTDELSEGAGVVKSSAPNRSFDPD